jgi:hypothetical protein
VNAASVKNEDRVALDGFVLASTAYASPVYVSECVCEYECVCVSMSVCVCEYECV